jgi:hypothetical protein
MNYPHHSRLFRLLSILLIICSIQAGCKRSRHGGNRAGSVEADYINYRVEYLENKAGDIPTNLLPDEMQAYYTRDYILTRIDGFFGQFSLVQVANLKKRTVTTMLNFFGNKVYYTGERNEHPVSIHPLDHPEIILTDDMETIAGIPSFRAEIHLPKETYDIYYTEDIKVKTPNITTPYHFIDYVLSDFRVQLSYLKMRLIMEEHAQQEIDNAMFRIPEDYQPVSRKEMEDIINSLFTKD